MGDGRLIRVQEAPHFSVREDVTLLNKSLLHFNISKRPQGKEEFAIADLESAVKEESKKGIFYHVLLNVYSSIDD